MEINSQNFTKPQLDVANLKVLEDQLNYEHMMNKKLSQYAQYCTDPQLKNVCQQGSQKHNQNFNNLLNYLNSHK